MAADSPGRVLYLSSEDWGGINDVDYRSLSLMSEMEKKARQLYAILSKYNGDWRYAVRRPDQGVYYGGNVTLNESEGYIGFTGGGFSSSSSVPTGYPFPQDSSNWNTLKQEILNLGDCSFSKVVNGYDSQEFSDCFLDADATYNSVSSGGKGLRFYQRSSTSSAISYPIRFYFR